MAALGLAVREIEYVAEQPAERRAQHVQNLSGWPARASCHVRGQVSLAIGATAPVAGASIDAAGRRSSPMRQVPKSRGKPLSVIKT